ncbi:MAG TPA: hypothetical protein VNH46_10105 [Gemmatimonadales bacterium]|nr:hypothetical protein [Gemmatimonadales bacterium]
MASSSPALPRPTGVSMRLYLAPDSDLRAFAVAPRTLQLWLRSPRPWPIISLQQSWADLGAILAAVAPEAASPLSPQGADYTYPFVADRGAYALSSPSTEDLLRRLERVTASVVEAYVRGDAPAPEPASPAGRQLAARTEELLASLARLREHCALAVEKRYGLLMALWGEPG